MTVRTLIDAVRRRPALQQPDWAAGPERAALAARDPLVRAEEVAALRAGLAEAAHGRALVVQAGDCAEDPDDSAPHRTAARLALLDALAAELETTGQPVLRVGRLAGQYAKPRSAPYELVDGVRLPAYRGPMVNAPHDRTPDPTRLLSCRDAAETVLAAVRRRAEPLWVSHEALLLDYELPQLRSDPVAGPVLTSTHWPWIGERTRQPHGAHVRLLAGVANPVACKVGPGTAPAELVRLCALLDPARSPGRLTLITRYGTDRIGTLPTLVAAVRAAGHPVLWLCDPMHGNTITAPDGRKTRRVADVLAEARAFAELVPAAGGTAAGLHLEATPDPVTECLGPHLDGPYTTLCDPRLSPAQALTVAAGFTAALQRRSRPSAAVSSPRQHT